MLIRRVVPAMATASGLGLAASRYWPFQGIEGGGLLLLAILLVAATIWLVHRRAA